MQKMQSVKNNFKGILNAPNRVCTQVRLERSARHRFVQFHVTLGNLPDELRREVGERLALFPLKSVVHQPLPDELLG